MELNRLRQADEAFQPVTVVRVAPGARSSDTDVAATEEPMEIRLNGEAFAVIMRTPGEDRELTAGFLFSERVIHTLGEIGSIRHCQFDELAGTTGKLDRQNIVDVQVLGDVSQRLADRRRVMMNSSCGLCGRTTIESLRADAPRIAAAWTIPQSMIAGLPARLRANQSGFSETGGLHAAALFTLDGAVEAAAEDVGRHNAVDKVIGRMLLVERLPLGSSILMVSGRSSFEIVQKAFLAGIPVVAAVSAPSSLAIELADEAGITLAGFVRGDTFNVYAHPERIA